MCKRLLNLCFVELAGVPTAKAKINVGETTERLSPVGYGFIGATNIHCVLRK